MSEQVQLILKDGQPEYAVVPYQLYEQLVEDAETLADIAAYEEVKQALAEGDEEQLPLEVVEALVEGANPLAVWRQYRELTQAALAEAAEISIPYLSQLEGGKRQGSTAVWQRLAQALKVDLEDLLV